MSSSSSDSSAPSSYSLPAAATPTSDSVPLVSSLSSIYLNPSEAESRYASLYSSFLSQHGAAPQAFIRAPGRVNLIGEHIDYMGYAVLPMAIEQDVIIAVGKKSQENFVRSVTDHTTNKTKSPAKTRAELLGGIVSQPKIFLSNIKQSVYESRTFGSLRDAANISASFFQSLSGKTKWTGYVQCGLKGVLETIGASSPAPSSSELESTVEGMAFLVDGSIPPAAGLSSSSALVCASALSLSFALNYHFNKTKSQLSDVCRNCEKYIGTEGGGMDQAISFLSQRNSAQKIDFFPLKNTSVPLPEGAAFVIANSYYVSEKAQAATKHYNMRVLECKLAALLLAAHFNILAFGNESDKKFVQASSGITLKEVQEKSGRSLKELVEYLNSPVSDNAPLHAHPYNRTEIESKLANYRSELKASFDKPFRLSDVFADNENLSRAFSDSAEILLFQRALHVYGEAVRVEQFQSVCNRGVGPSGAGALLNELGTLMTESHTSCSTLYNCSCEDLEQLCASALESGAYGARLTGAGWGGCIVALIDQDKAQSFVEQMKQKYYIKYKEWKENDPRLQKEAIFITKPGTGAAIVQSERPFVVSAPPPPPPAPIPEPEPVPLPLPVSEPIPEPIPEPEPEPVPVPVDQPKEEESSEVSWGLPRSKTAWFIIGLLQVAIIAAVVYARKKKQMK